MALPFQIHLQGKILRAKREFAGNANDTLCARVSTADGTRLGGGALDYRINTIAAAGNALSEI
jgi:hypothetical protein